MSKEKFDRSKPHVNVGTIGHIDHGKTTLTAALTKVSADKGWGKFVSYDQVAKASESQGRRDDLRVVADGPALRDVGVRDRVTAELLAHHLRDRGRERRLAVVDVTDRADVHVRIISLELLLRHLAPLAPFRS